MPKIRFRGKPVDPIDLDALPEYADWIKDGWVYGYLIGKDVIVGEIVEFGEDYFNTEFWCRVKIDSVGQFAGLHDKNGDRAYTGDIIGGIWEPCYIGYCKVCKQFQLFLNSFGCMACMGEVHWYELVTYDRKIKIIGNIHDNPELLEG